MRFFGFIRVLGETVVTSLCLDVFRPIRQRIGLAAKRDSRVFPRLIAAWRCEARGQLCTTILRLMGKNRSLDFLNDSVQSLARFMFPKPHHFIPLSLEKGANLSISSLVAGKLPVPIALPRIGAPVARFAAVPEATIDTDDDSSLGEIKVWFAINVLRVHAPASKAGANKGSPDSVFRRVIASPADARHRARSYGVNVVKRRHLVLAVVNWVSSFTHASAGSSIGARSLRI